MTPEDEDVKALLGRALAGEPPLALDRDEVFRQGRRKLRNRRLFSAGGAISGAVVAVVGAVVLTGLIAEEPVPETPPAATRTERPAPPGPTLPLTTTQQGPSTSYTPLEPTADHASALTRALLATLPADARPSRLDGEPPRFKPAQDTYEFAADIETGTADGSLSVSVGSAPAAAEAACAQVADANAGCAIRTARDVVVAVGTWKDHGTGEKRYIVYAVRRDGTSVTAIATNLSERRRTYGKNPADPAPVVDAARLAEIVTLPGLRFG
jgi:hypothetical protein